MFFLFAIAALVPIWRRTLGIVYLTATVNLTFLAWLKYQDAGLGLGQLIEHASQFCLPVTLALLGWGKRWVMLAKVSIAATFVGHGLFSIGLSSDIIWLNHPRPGSFTEMTMLCLEFVSESAAGQILLVAGTADLIVAVMIFLPPWLRTPGLWYMALWGGLTALARPWAYYEPTAASETLLRWIPELLYRAPHLGLPLCLLLALRRNRPKFGRPAAPS